MTRYFEHTVSVKIKLSISIENFSLFVAISLFDNYKNIEILSLEELQTFETL